jgi:serine kinase of HPr protein (carbohydrate metabolism regulator)
MSPQPESQVVHAGLIALYDARAWKGVLIQGPSGVGKSDLALRAFSLGFRLVADDRTLLWASQGRLYGRCPPAIAGLIEARGLGVMPQATRAFAQIRLIVRCLPAGARLDRMPVEAQQSLLGVDLPTLDLRPLEASSPMKLLHALSLLGGAP